MSKTKTFCLLNHKLTQNQLTELKERFDSEEVIYPNEELSQKWSKIPSTFELNKDIINSVVSWLSSANENDIFIIQGEFGSTFMLVDYALKKKLIPVHAVTDRIAKETVNGEVVHREYVFEHKCFRKYEYYTED